MDRFKKLSRAEMKKVSGGTMPPGCTNDCQLDGSVKCETGKTCSSVKCPDDANYYHNICS
jgi:hypothetical protein